MHVKVNPGERVMYGKAKGEGKTYGDGEKAGLVFECDDETGASLVERALVTELSAEEVKALTAAKKTAAK